MIRAIIIDDYEAQPEVHEFSSAEELEGFRRGVAAIAHSWRDRIGVYTLEDLPELETCGFLKAEEAARKARKMLEAGQ